MQIAMFEEYVETVMALATDNSQHSEWYTPGEYIIAARAVMGDIDLDPASCEFANRTVQAKRYFTKADNGLSRQWHGRIWLNPPYSEGTGEKGGAAAWARKLLTEYMRNHVRQAIMLVNLATAYQPAFQELGDYGPICLPGRISFYNGIRGEVEGSPRQAHVFFYIGDRPGAFTREFRQFGNVYVPA